MKVTSIYSTFFNAIIRAASAPIVPRDCKLQSLFNPRPKDPRHDEWLKGWRVFTIILSISGLGLQLGWFTIDEFQAVDNPRVWIFFFSGLTSTSCILTLITYSLFHFTVRDDLVDAPRATIFMVHCYNAMFVWSVLILCGWITAVCWVPDNYTDSMVAQHCIPITLFMTDAIYFQGPVRMRGWMSGSAYGCLLMIYWSIFCLADFSTKYSLKVPKMLYSGLYLVDGWKVGAGMFAFCFGGPIIVGLSLSMVFDQKKYWLGKTSVAHYETLDIKLGRRRK